MIKKKKKKHLPQHYLERILVEAMVLPGITTNTSKLVSKHSCDTSLTLGKQNAS